MRSKKRIELELLKNCKWQKENRKNNKSREIWTFRKEKSKNLRKQKER